MNPLIQQFMAFLQKQQQSQSESEMLLQLVYRMLHSKYNTDFHTPDNMRENEQKEQESATDNHETQKIEYLKEMLHAQQEPKRTVPKAQVQTTRKIY